MSTKTGGCSRNGKTRDARRGATRELFPQIGARRGTRHTSGVVAAEGSTEHPFAVSSRKAAVGSGSSGDLVVHWSSVKRRRTEERALRKERTAGKAGGGQRQRGGGKAGGLAVPASRRLRFTGGRRRDQRRWLRPGMLETVAGGAEVSAGAVDLCGRGREKNERSGRGPGALEVLAQPQRATGGPGPQRHLQQRRL